MWKTLSELFAAAAGATATEIIDAVYNVGLSAIGLANPIEAFATTSEVLLGLMDALEKLANAVAQIARVANMKYHIDKLRVMANEMKSAAGTMQDKYVVISKLIRTGVKKEI